MIRSSTLGWSGALLGSLIAVAACGSTTGGTSSAAGSATATSSQSSSAAASSTPAASAPALTAVVDPCTLITEDEAHAALGADPGPGRASSASCGYGGAGGTAGFMFVSDASTDKIPGITNASQDTVKALIQQEAQKTGATVQDLVGVGDYGFLVLNKSGSYAMFVKGSTFVSIVVQLPAEAAPTVDTMTTLAKAAANRV